MSQSKKIEYLQRWMFIIDKINSHPYISAKELQKAIEEEFVLYDGVEKTGIGIRTIERDIEEIRNSPYMDISIENNRHKGGYYIPQDEESQSKLDRLFEVSSLFSFKKLKDIVFMEDRKSRGLEYRLNLINAIRNSKEIIIEYKKYGCSGKTLRLQPYALKEVKNRWYLLAIYAGRESCCDSIRTFGLDRIQKLEVTGRKFQKNDAINPNKEFEHCFGIISDKELEPQKVILSFEPLSGNYHLAYPLHKSQKVVIHNEEEIRIQLTVKITFDFIIELLTQSHSIRVIEPVSLKEELIEIHRQAIELLKK